MYKDGKLAGNKIEPVDGILKRGMWKYSLSDPQFTERNVTLDNGVSLDLVRTQQLIDQKKKFLVERKKSMTWVKEPTPEDQEDVVKKIKVAPVKGKPGAKKK